MSESNNVRGVLLAALGLGEWEAEHLTGLQLARRLAAIHLVTVDRLSALGYQCQALAVEKQELLSGEEVSRLAEQVAGLEAENARLRRSREFCQDWYAARWERLRQLIHDDARHIEDDACRVMANGTVSPDETPTYARTVSVLRNTVASLEAENARLRAAACLAGVAVTDDDGEA